MTSTYGYGDNPVHPILERAFEYDIIRFDFRCDPQNWEQYLDLWLRRGEDVKVLRFLRPTGLKIEEGFPSPTRGMIILDVTHWGWENVGVQVTDFENSHGRIHFYAKSVAERSRED
ncbi:MAG: hypothetical protein JWM57_2662 [Phycisphaerales bacterium]|nr:hypothetical protein [Phycisphaerales bacterium]